MNEILAGLKMAKNAQGNLSDSEYFWVVLFSWYEDNPRPFQVIVREVFSEKDIPVAWFQRKLTPSKRHQKG